MNKKIKAEWVAALRSGEYKQGRGHLRDVEDNFCCLGVLCNLHAQHHPDIAKTHFNKSFYMNEGTTLPLAVLQWAGLDSSDPIVDGHFLSTWNDGLNTSLRHVDPLNFEQIADLIEKNL